MDDWRGQHEDPAMHSPALQEAKLEDLMRSEPKNDTGHDAPFADLFIH